MRRRSPLRWSILPALAAALAPRAAAAQARTGEFTVQSFEPAPGPKNLLTVEGLRMNGGWAFSLGAMVNYAKNPFVVKSCASATDCSDKSAVQPNDVHVVSDLVTTDVLAAVSPVPRLQVGLRLPLTNVNGEGIDPSTGLGVPGGQKKFGVGDPDLEGKVRILGDAKDPYLLGAAVDLSFPVGHAFSTSTTDYYLGNSSPVTAGVRAIFDGTAGPLQFGANLRGVFRQAATLGTTRIGPADLRYSAGLGFRVSPIFRIMAEGFGSTQLSSKAGTNTLETDGALEVSLLESQLVLRAGGGAGVLQGVGTPQGRAFFGVAFTHEVIDTDRDTIPDTADKCPTIAEDFDGFEDQDGCPEADNDNDRIPDVADRCPNTSETINGYQDADGCPDDLPDRDHDGIDDARDKCPDAGGPDILRDPNSKYYGCPDRDHDGIPDVVDRCPDAPEPTDDLFDGSGCPHVRDTDKDGIPDDKDKCPTEPETYNGYQDADGCPDKGPTTVDISDRSIEVHGRIEFATNKDKIEGAKSFQVLDAVAGIMTGHQEIQRVEVQGHTDGAGVAAQNRTLSQKRAEAVVRYLAGKGVDPRRLVAKGYGPDRPIADNKSAAGRQKNRRVEFVILETTGKGAVSPPAPPQPAAPPPASAPPAKAPPAKAHPKGAPRSPVRPAPKR